MPFYLCTTPSGSLGAGQRQQIAKEITRIHCDETGAPPENPERVPDFYREHVPHTPSSSSTPPCAFRTRLAV